MKPYGRRALTREERIANYRISRARPVVENAFSILVSSFKALLKPMEQDPERVRDIVMSCIVLHNILGSWAPRQAVGQGPEDDQLSDSGLMDGGDGSDGHQRNPSREAKDQREYLKDYFNHAGAVPWQKAQL